MTEEQNDEHEIKRVLGVFAHPDDPEFFCGATLARWAAEGAEITFLMATSGDKGSDDLDMTREKLVEIREQEERNAAAKLGVHDVIFLRCPDGELQPTLELRKTITRYIRMKKPDTVVTSDPTAYWYGSGYINHPDHRIIGDATLAAVFPIARDRLNYLEMERDEGISPHKVRNVYVAIPADATTEVDVTNYIDKKVEALREHKSQIKDMDELADRIRERSLDPRAPESAPRYIERFRVFKLG
jgi:LmbE family N-acetylglucosaminyl deacetylase